MQSFKCYIYFSLSNTEYLKQYYVWHYYFERPQSFQFYVGIVFWFAGFCSCGHSFLFN